MKGFSICNSRVKRTLETRCGREAMEVRQISWKKTARKTTWYSSLRKQKAVSLYPGLSYKKTPTKQTPKKPQLPKQTPQTPNKKLQPTPQKIFTKPHGKIHYGSTAHEGCNAATEFLPYLWVYREKNNFAKCLSQSPKRCSVTCQIILTCTSYLID